MRDNPIALVTGANQGIGFQIAKDLSTHGFTVLIGSRNVVQGKAAAVEIGAQALQLDVTDTSSIAAAADRISTEFRRLDLLVQNAAISNTDRQPGQSVEEHAKTTRPSNMSLDSMRLIWDTNVFGVLAVYQAMLPMLRKSSNARIINISSGAGSLSRASDPAFPGRAIFGPGYAASKTALNALTLAMAIELEPEGIKVNAVSPGFIKTNLNGFAGTGTVEEGARETVRLALSGSEGPTGTFTRWQNEPIPW
jgi:NAD(P)-dependent dehydrogenase (short-subunit alcohol dehydrogenase family)